MKRTGGESNEETEQDGLVHLSWLTVWYMSGASVPSTRPLSLSPLHSRTVPNVVVAVLPRDGCMSVQRDPDDSEDMSGSLKVSWVCLKYQQEGRA